MPLLSTLAAVVILVSSAEDNLEREYRYDLRPRALDNPPDYDQVAINITNVFLRRHLVQTL